MNKSGKRILLLLAVICVFLFAEAYADSTDTLAIRGRHYPVTNSFMNLSGIGEDDIGRFETLAPQMTNLKEIDLGSEDVSPVSWEIISRIQAAVPDARIRYSFSLYGEPVTLDTEYIDLRKISVDDNGKAVMAALKCMKKCTYLDMDCSGVDDEHMAVIRDAFPDVKVVWRVKFGKLDYSVRTDVKTILASLTGEGGWLGITNEASAVPLTYCTDVINLDLGHSSQMRTTSFLRYMPNLEVFITYENYLPDISDLVYCKKLKYLELFGSSMTDVSPIAELENLTDLMLCACYKVTDISPLIPSDVLPNLKRLYIAGTSSHVPAEQIEAFIANHPDCEVNTTENSVGTHWRFIDLGIGNSEENRVPAYREICNIFHYRNPEKDQSSYSFSRNDPYYTTPHGQPVEGKQLEWFYGDNHFEG